MHTYMRTRHRAAAAADSDTVGAARALAPDFFQAACRCAADGAMSAAVILDMEPRDAAAAAVAMGAIWLLKRHFGTCVPPAQVLPLLAADVPGGVRELQKNMESFALVYRILQAHDY